MTTTAETARENRIDSLRVASRARLENRLARIEAKAAPMVGELSSGKFYVWPVGGRYFESASHSACVDYLARNGWLA